MVDEPDFQVAGDRLPPQNIQAEEDILGGILLDPEAIGRVANILRPEAFSLQAHQHLYRCALTLQNEGKPTDLTTVTTWLSDQKMLDQVGGMSKLAQLVDRTVSAVNIDEYAKLVMDKYLRRQLIRAGDDIVGLGFETHTELEVVMDRAEQKIFDLRTDRFQQGLVPISKTLIGAFQEIEIQNQGTALPGIPCGFYDLDALTGGFQRSDLIIVAGRPSMGKCLASNAVILLATGEVATIAEIYQRRQAQLLTLGEDRKFGITSPSAFVDDGIKPVFRVQTRLGRVVETTITHPFLTINGWQQLGKLKRGDRIAVPRRLEVFGTESLPDCRIKLLAYLIGGRGCLLGASPKFTNGNQRLQKDFVQAVSLLPGLKVTYQTSQGTRKPSLYVTADLEFIAKNRQLFGSSLRTILQSKSISNKKLAQAVGVSGSLVCLWQQGGCVPNQETFSQLCEFLQVDPEKLAPHGLAAISKNSKNTLTLWLQELGLWGKKAHTKTVPPVVFKLKRSQLALFLNRLFSTDGWATVYASGQSQVGSATASEELARQIQHLLLRFGIIAALKKRSFNYKDPRAWQLNITDSESIRTFICEIGIFGKEENLSLVQAAGHQNNCALIPVDIWQVIAAAKGNEPWSVLAQRAGIRGYSNIHVGKRVLSRERLLTWARALDNRPLQQLATSDVYWDEIVSIVPVGWQQVYDLTIPETHNFVANDICVHNTSFALNIARSIAAKPKLPIAIFSLEMSCEQLVMRLLSSEANIESNRLRSGRITQLEWGPLSTALSTLSDLPIFIDDTPNQTVSQMRSQARRLQAEQGGVLGLILIDYLQLMEGASDNRVQELSRITRQLKGLARWLNVPVITLSQLSRGVESRNNKRPMMSDLRESGSIEQDSDLILMLYRDEYYNPDTPDRNIAEVIITKHRNGPTGVVKLLFDSHLTRFRNLAPRDRS
ncbi:MAG: replicative DNA helicase [Hormoscilla sp. GM102CHS1]|nr:replicative DNA helicase [Hormoscilla sp. GM102CHS1]